MMFKAVAIALLIVAAHRGIAAEQEPRPGSEEPTPQAQAEQRARETLAQHLKIGTEMIAVTDVEARTWTDSSMGCAKPGTAALTVITEGYAVSLTAQGREYRVHVSGNNAIICDKSVAARRDAHTAARARGLDVMMEQARQDLAQRLGVDAAKIRLAGMSPQLWSTDTPGCTIPFAASSSAPVKGFRLSLSYAGRVYDYHSDRRNVSACPPIEAQ